MALTGVGLNIGQFKSGGVHETFYVNSILKFISFLRGNTLYLSHAAQPFSILYRINRFLF
jgi:hypothetical protein